MHTVALNGFWIDRTEVTNFQYRQCVKARACSPPSSLQSHSRENYYNNPEYDNYPVIYVTWHQAQEYAEWVGGRLPTEAEWEYAARGPSGNIYPWGNSAPNDLLANHDNRVGDTTEVGSYPDGASWCGVLDMAGNAWEWTSTLYRRYPYDFTDGRESFEVGEDPRRIVRGGSWACFSAHARCAYRFGSAPTTPWSQGGFRVVISSISP